MSLDPRFVLAYWASDYFVDKDTGLPLANGVVTFYRDNARTELKNIYTLRGLPPYTANSYVPLPNPMTLSSTGTPQDNDGNNVDIYFYPYLGNPTGNDDTLDLYFIRCEDENSILQFTRCAIPNLNEQQTPLVEEIENFIPNPQFVTHNSGESNGSTSDGEIQQAVTNIAPGYWYFQRPNGSTATDYVSFYRFTGPIAPPPTGNPRYAVEIENTSPAGSDAFKYLMVRFPNVNKFIVENQTYTLWFEAVSVGLAEVTAEVRVIKYFGSGGSATQTIAQADIDIPVSWDSIRVPISFGTNTGATIGSNNDDYIAVAINLPVSSTFKVRLTNFVLTTGNITLAAFPAATNAQNLSLSLAGNSTPDYDGYDLGLPVILGRNGYESDQSIVGKLSPIGYETSSIHWTEVLCDGSGYVTSDYTDDGIPYARLQAKLFNAAGFPLFGTAPNFIISNLGDTSGNFSIATNLPGAQTAAANGTTAFTFTTIGTGATTYGLTAYHYWQSANTTALLLGNTVGPVATYAADVDTGATIFQFRNEENSYQGFTVDTSTINPAALAGKYFTFQTTPSNDFYVWFKVGGLGSDPGGSGTAILINLPASPTTSEICAAIVSVLNGATYSNCLVSTPPTAGQYWTFNANSQQYVVWYEVNGAGSEPSVPSAILIKVTLGAAPTAAQTAEATKLALNMYSFAVPDLRGVVIRGVDSTGVWDINYASRFSKNPRGTNTIAGSLQLDSILHHEHASPGFAGLTVGDGGNPVTISPLTTDATANTFYTEYHMMTNNPPESVLVANIGDYTIDEGETRGTNMAFNWVIKL